MKEFHSRRQSLRAMIGAAVVPALALGFPRLVVAAGGQFDPPAAPMRLTRTLVRDLPDGAEISVKRDWEVRFIRTMAGFSLNGRQIAVEVEAPPALEFLGQLEKKRQESSLFPLALSPNGMIAADGQKPDSELFDLAIAGAAQRISQSALSADSARLTGESLAALQKSATDLISRLPLDLFRPGQLHWQDNRTVALPQGLTGTVSITFDSRLDAVGQLMEQSERRIVSSIGGSSRTSSEIWQLART